MSETRLVLLDLDGTLIDSRPGIVASLHGSLATLGVALEPNHDFTWCIGASLWDIYRHYLGTQNKADLDNAVALYRSIYREGPMFQFDVYDGVLEALLEMSRSGYKLVLATAKAHVYAREVIQSCDLASVISAVYGSELDGTNVGKSDLIRHILREESQNPKNSVMVGDRHHDIDGATANGVASIGVTYGYGTKEEIAHASYLVHHASALPRMVNQLLQN